MLYYGACREWSSSGQAKVAGWVGPKLSNGACARKTCASIFRNPLWQCRDLIQSVVMYKVNLHLSMMENSDGGGGSGLETLIFYQNGQLLCNRLHQ